MPIYEFLCDDCRRRTSVFTRSVSSPVAALCEHCGSSNLSRLISRVVHVKGEAQRLAETDPNRLMGYLDGDQRLPERGDFAHWARRLSRELGGEMGAKFREMAEKTEADPYSLERMDPHHTLNYVLNDRYEQVTKEAKGPAGAGESDGGGE